MSARSTNAPAAESAPRAKTAAAVAGAPPAHGELVERARDVWAARAVVVLAAIATFARGVPGPLVGSWDDRRFLIDNPDVHRVSWSSFVSMVSEPRFEAYQPLHLLSYWLDVPWAGASGPVIHAVSLALWCGALLLVLELMRKLGLGIVAAALATLLFGLHTVQVEAVTWATGRKDILAIGLACGSALAHLRSERPADRASWLALSLYVLAALSKTAVLPLPLVLLAADVFLRGRTVRRAGIAAAPGIVIGVVLAAAVIALWDANELIRGGDEARDASLVLVPATIAHHLATAVWPSATSPMYALARDEMPSVLGAIAGCGALIAAGVIAWRAREGETGRRVLFGLIAFVLLLAPVSNVVPLYFQWHDRYLAVPLLGLAFALGALIDAALRTPRGLRATSARWVLAITGAAVIALAARTVQYQAVWRSDEALWGHAVQTHPRAFYGWLKLGEVRRDAGQLEGALRAYEQAIEVAPRLRLGHAAYLSALALRDERDLQLAPSRATEIAQRFIVQMEAPIELRALAGELADEGYRQSVMYVLARAMDLEPIADDRLERAATVQLAQGKHWLARFYIGRLRREPVMPQVIAFIAHERARLRAARGETDDEAPIAPDATDRDATDRDATGRDATDLEPTRP